MSVRLIKKKAIMSFLSRLDRFDGPKKLWYVHAIYIFFMTADMIKILWYPLLDGFCGSPYNYIYFQIK
jgi:hypothetical protein